MGFIKGFFFRVVKTFFLNPNSGAGAAATATAATTAAAGTFLLRTE